MNGPCFTRSACCGIRHRQPLHSEFRSHGGRTWRFRENDTKNADARPDIVCLADGFYARVDKDDLLGIGGRYVPGVRPDGEPLAAVTTNRHVRPRDRGSALPSPP